MQRILAAIGFLASSSCTHPEHPQPIVGNSHAADTFDPARDTLGAKLAREIGAGHAVAILPTARGLVAVSSTGEHATVLVPGPIAWVLVDERANVAWFAHDERDTIYALDLDAPPATRPHTVVEHAPPRYGEFEVRYAPVHPDPAEPLAAQLVAISLSLDLRIDRVILDAAPAPALVGVDGVYDSGTQLADGVARDAKLADVAFAKAIFARADRSAFVEQAKVGVEGIDPTKCETPTDCGQGVMITGTKYASIVVGSACVDGCNQFHQIYDLTTKALVTDDWGSWLVNGATLSPDHAAFVSDGRLVRFDRGPVLVPPDGDGNRHGGGWLGANSGDRYY